MRVLWVYKVFDVGGAEQLLLELLPHLQSHVQVIPVAMDGSTGAMAERYRSAGLSPVDLQASSSFDISSPAATSASTLIFAASWRSRRTSFA